MYHALTLRNLRTAAEKNLQGAFTRVREGGRCSRTAATIPIIPLASAWMLDDAAGHVELVKIDTEGAEVQILEGLLPYVCKSHVGAIDVDLMPHAWERRGASDARALSALRGLTPSLSSNAVGSSSQPASHKRVRASPAPCHVIPSGNVATASLYYNNWCCLTVLLTLPVLVVSLVATTPARCGAVPFAHNSRMLCRRVEITGCV
jgi:hypothetical protein